MKIAVVGAGVVGVACALELSQDGHEVTVFERRSTVAEEASFASGALMAAGWMAPWNPDSLQIHSPWSKSPEGLRLARLPVGLEWGWLWQWRKAHREPLHRDAQAHIHRLVSYSQERLQTITHLHQLEHERSHGMLVLLRTAREVDHAQAALAQLREVGMPARALTAEQARELEPALNIDTALHGAIELGGLAAANCREFAVLLRAQAQEAGCRFAFNTIVARVGSTPPAGFQLELVHTASHPLRADQPSEQRQFDAVVVCTGAASAGMLSPLGLRLPLQAVRGHSLSAAVREPMDAPQSAVLDAHLGVSIARLGQRVRVAGGREWGRESNVPSKAGLQRLYRALNDWFPGAVRLAGPAGRVQEWSGAQGSVPDGAPLLGASRIPDLWLNIGHGACGWSMACGAARVLADQIGGRAPELSVDPFSPRRYGV